MKPLLLQLHDQPKVTWAGPALYRGPSSNRFQIEDLYTLHLFQYQGSFYCNDTHFKVRPGTLTLSPPYSKLEFIYEDKTCPLHSFHFILPKKGKDDSFEMPEIQHFSPKHVIHQEFIRGSEAFSINPFQCEVALWNLLLTCSKKLEGNHALSKSTIVQQCVLFIHGNLGDNLRVSDMATKFQVSPTHLARCFKKELGVGVSEYLREHRLRKAVELLTYTTQTIKSIAAQIGIPDLQYFNKTFRNYTGVSPRAFRHKHKGI